jgi:hypothetical protein
MRSQSRGSRRTSASNQQSYREQFAQELRALVHLRNDTIQHLGDRTRHLHKEIDLTFSEFTRNVRGLDTELATTILVRYPTASSFLKARIGQLAGLCFDGRRRVGAALARELIKAAKESVGSDQTDTCAMQVRYADSRIGHAEAGNSPSHCDTSRLSASLMARSARTFASISSILVSVRRVVWVAAVPGDARCAIRVRAGTPPTPPSRSTRPYLRFVPL